MTPLHVIQACRRAQDALLIATEKPPPKITGGGSSSVEPPTPLPVSIISAKRELRDLLLDWCSLIRDGLDVIRTYDLTEESMLEWIGSGERADYLAAHEAGLDFLEELTLVTKALETPYAPRPTRTFLGVHAGEEIHIKEGQTLVDLADGTVERVESVRAWNRDQVRLAEGTAKEVAEMIWEFFGQYINPRKISLTKDHDHDPRYKVQNKLTPTRKDGRKHIYRVQDVLTRFQLG